MTWSRSGNRQQVDLKSSGVQSFNRRSGTLSCGGKNTDGAVLAKFFGLMESAIGQR